MFVQHRWVKHNDVPINRDLLIQRPNRASRYNVPIIQVICEYVYFDVCTIEVNWRNNITIAIFPSCLTTMKKRSRNLPPPRPLLSLFELNSDQMRVGWMDVRADVFGPLGIVLSMMWWMMMR